MALTFAFLHHSPRLGQGKALHRLVSLAHFRTGVYVFQNVMRYFHQHTAVKCMAFLSLGLICPGNSINFRKQIERSFVKETLYLCQKMSPSTCNISKRTWLIQVSTIYCMKTIERIFLKTYQNLQVSF